jgi:hypothetical protein
MRAKVSLRLFLFIVVVMATPLQASELRVVGPSGLTRAFSPVHGAARVEVRLVQESIARGIHPSALTLFNVDGYSSDIEASGGTDGLFIFAHVPGGTWQIKVAEEDVKLQGVRIIKRQSNIADMDISE